MLNNANRNSGKKFNLNMTGHMSEIMVKSMPYCINEASKILESHHLEQIKFYIEHTILDGNQQITWIQSDIHWESKNDLNDSDSNTASDDDDNNNLINDNYSDIDIVVNANTNSNNNAPSNLIDIDTYIIDEQKDIVLDNAAETNNSNNLFILYDNINSSQLNNNNENNNNNSNISNDNINNNNHPVDISNHLICYDYLYTINNSNNVYTFNNNDNKANINYYDMFNLAVFYDYCHGLRKVLQIYRTLQWPKNIHHQTPSDIKKCHIIARSSVYKAKIFGNWLLHPYSKWACGVGSYFLESFWHYNPDGYGFYVVCQQMAEHWGKWMKDNRRNCGSSNGDNYLYELADNYDIYVLGRTLNDLIDLKKVVKDEKITESSRMTIDMIDDLEQNIFHDAPMYFQMLTFILNQIKVGDEIPDILSNIHRRDPTKWYLHRNNLNQHIIDIVNQDHNQQQIHQRNSQPQQNMQPQQQQPQSQQHRQPSMLDRLSAAADIRDNMI